MEVFIPDSLSKKLDREFFFSPNIRSGSVKNGQIRNSKCVGNIDGLITVKNAVLSDSGRYSCSLPHFPQADWQSITDKQSLD